MGIPTSRKWARYGGLSWGLMVLALLLAASPAAAVSGDGSVLPFPPTPSASVAAPTLQESKHQRRVEPSRLRKDAPNILIILLDDVGFGLPDTFGGPIHTPTLSRLAGEGIRYNAFHTTSICSPTRAALLTGRNHQRVGSGTIAERAVDWDGYVGVMPKTAATMAEVLRHYGYKTSAFGKWHNTPADQTTAMGPFTYWPTGYGFDYFYGFLAGETSQWEPRLVENTNFIEPPHDEKYHLTEDMADKALTWLKRHRAFSPDKPFFMYWAPGAAHGPHHIFPEWADKYKGRFDAGWDAMRESTFKRQKELGWIPAERPAHPPSGEHAGVGQHSADRTRVPAPVSWRSSPASSSTPTSRWAGWWTASMPWGSAKTRSSSISGATTGRAPRGRTAASANCSRKTASRAPSSSRWRR